MRLLRKRTNTRQLENKAAAELLFTTHAFFRNLNCVVQFPHASLFLESGANKYFKNSCRISNVGLPFDGSAGELVAARQKIRQSALIPPVSHPSNSLANNRMAAGRVRRLSVGTLHLFTDSLIAYISLL